MTATRHYVELDDGRELLVLVEAHVSAYDPGVSSGPVEACYPPEGGEVEFERILVYGIGPSVGPVPNAVGFDATTFGEVFGARQFAELEEEIFQHAQEPCDDYDYWSDR